MTRDAALQLLYALDNLIDHSPTAQPLPLLQTLREALMQLWKISPSVDDHAAAFRRLSADALDRPEALDAMTKFICAMCHPIFSADRQTNDQCHIIAAQLQVLRAWHARILPACRERQEDQIREMLRHLEDRLVLLDEAFQHALHLKRTQDTCQVRALRSERMQQLHQLRQAGAVDEADRIATTTEHIIQKINQNYLEES